MGIFKKIFKGVKKVFKKIGKAIKRAFKKIGKFMGKLGIIGQIGLAFLLPGVGGLLGKAATFLGSSSSALLQGVGQVLQTAVNFGKTAGKVFSTVTDAVGGFVKQVGGTFLKKMGVSPEWLASKGFGTADTFAEGFRGWMDGVGKSVGAVRDSAAAIFDPFKKDALGLDFNQRSILSRAADSVADVVPASSSEAAFQAIDEAASGSLMGTPQTTGSLSEYIKRPDLENVVPAFDLEASIKAFDEAASGKPQTTDYLSQYIKRPEEVGGYPVNEAMLKPEGLNPAEATEAVIEETAKAATEQNESLFGKLTENIKAMPGEIGKRFVDDVTQIGSNYLLQATGLMPQTEQVQTASGGTVYTSGVDYSLQSSPFMSTFNQGMVNTNYNALFDQIYSYQPRGYA